MLPVWVETSSSCCSEWIFGNGEIIGPAAIYGSDIPDPAAIWTIMRQDGPLRSLTPFDETGGYIGIRMPFGWSPDYLYGWAHVAGVTDFGTPLVRATIDGWAYETELNEPIPAGAIPCACDACPVDAGGAWPAAAQAALSRGRRLVEAADARTT